MQRNVIVFSLLLGAMFLTACGGEAVGSDPDQGREDASTPVDGAAGQGNDGATTPIPAVHRSVASPCDTVRATLDPMAPAGDPSVSCTTHEECTDGINGRCGGNAHDGWYCTYDECFEDAECGEFVCACEGGFRADNNICLSQGNCRIDADCGDNGYCSPTLGSCGNYFGAVGYFCHTPQDECTDDADCEAPSYCAYNTIAGKWMCSSDQCVG